MAGFFLILSFGGQKFLILVKKIYQFFHIMFSAFCVHSTKSLLFPKWQVYSFYFSFKNFIVLTFTFKNLKHRILCMVQGEGGVFACSFFAFVVYMFIRSLQHHLLNRHSFDLGTFVIITIIM